MKWKKHLIYVAFSLFLVSCSSSSVFEAYHDFQNHIWIRSDIGAADNVVFTVPVNDVKQHFNIYLSLRYSSSLQIKSLPVYINIHCPNGEQRYKETAIQFKDSLAHEESEYLLKTNVWPDLSLPVVGNYQIEIGNLSNKYQIDGIHRIGLMIDKTE